MLNEMSLFVYGSFTEGMVHFSKIDQYVTQKQSAKVDGEIYRLPSGYPVFLLPANSSNLSADWISGQLVRIEAPDLVFKMLDEFHGYSSLVPEKSLFFKEQITAEAPDGSKVLAVVYAMNRAKLPKNSWRIEGGNWSQNMQAEPPLPTLLTERQASYVKRLRESTGREIVPIDLDIYRELMKLDLIVDKGRRLALSKLGKEVARYLPG